MELLAVLGLLTVIIRRPYHCCCCLPACCLLGLPSNLPCLPACQLAMRPVSEAAKAQRRKPAPLYADRVYDSVTRCMPTALERKLFARLLAARRTGGQQPPWAVREAARLVAWYR